MRIDESKKSEIPLVRIFLHLENPRFGHVNTEKKAIEELCNKEAVYPLAKDIVKNSLNPMEQIAVMPTGDKSNPERQNYTVVEGNRRVCALKLLIDPDLAPSKMRKRFKNLSTQWKEPLKKISAVVFDNYDEVKIWLERMHDGSLGGIGRKSWDAEQKQRFSGSKKNQAAQALLDYCEKHNILTKEDRKGKLTTVQRFITKDIFQEHVGLQIYPGGELKRTRPKDSFDQILRAFVSDLRNKKANSRMNKDDINQYARNLVNHVKPSNERVEPISIQKGKQPKQHKTKPKPKPPQTPKHLKNSSEIADGLKELDNFKLSHLYASLVNIDLELHTPLLCIGLWAFLETLTSCAGRNEKTCFHDFLSDSKMFEYGFKNKRDKKAIRDAIKRIQDFGNQTKHHKDSAAFNGKQLYNDLETTKPLIKKIIGGVLAHPTSQ